MKQTIRKESYRLYAPFALLVATGCVMAWLLSSENVAVVGYENGMHFFLSHLIYVGLGVGIVALMNRLDGEWFDKIGAILLALGLLLLALKLFMPQSGDVRESVAVAGVSVRFSLLLIPGMLWLTDYLCRRSAQVPQKVFYLFGVGFWGVWGLAFLFDPTMMFLAALVLLGMLAYRQGISKVFLVSTLMIAGLLAAMMLSSPHTMHRLQSWWENLGTGSTHPQLSGAALVQEKVGEGVFIYNDWGGVALFVVGVAVVWLVAALFKEKHLFAVGAAMLFAFDLLLNMVSFLGLTPFRPPVMFGAAHGELASVVAFVLLGMVVLRSKEARINANECQV